MVPLSESDSTIVHVCIGCGETKPLDEGHFHRNKLKRSGFLGKCKACVSVYNRAYRERHREDAQSYFRAYYLENRERIRGNVAANRAADPEKAAALVERWRKNNPDRKREHDRVRKARQRGGVGFESPGDLLRMYEDQGGLCAYCETPLFGTYHVDHMTPLCKGGEDGWMNYAITCPPCNMRKHDKTAEEFMTTVVVETL